MLTIVLFYKSLSKRYLICSFFVNKGLLHSKFSIYITKHFSISNFSLLHTNVWLSGFFLPFREKKFRHWRWGDEYQRKKRRILQNIFLTFNLHQSFLQKRENVNTEIKKYRHQNSAEKTLLKYVFQLEKRLSGVMDILIDVNGDEGLNEFPHQIY